MIWIEVPIEETRMQDSEIKQLADEIRAQLQVVPDAYPEHCISRVPKQWREFHREVFVPKIISIGPLHYKKRHLNMEDLKLCYTKSFLQQSPQFLLEDYLKAMQGLEERTRRCYGEKIELNSKNFKKMMLYDGCFIIELFLRFSRRFRHDPLFNKVGMLKTIKHDLILLENQLPFFVLQCLFNISTAFNGGPSLIELALYFFSDVIPGQNKRVAKEKGADIKHLLDLLRHSFEPPFPETLPLVREPDQTLLYGANFLKLKAGIKFKPCQNSETLLDIKFNSKGLMEVPKLKLQAETETLFRNLIAFEQCCEMSNSYITDYVSFMGKLVADWEDVDLLYEVGIIEDGVQMDRFAVADLFKSLCKDLIMQNQYYSGLCNRMNLHCISPQRTRLEIFMAHTHWIFYSFVVLLVFLRVIGYI